jgi:hypothetical protein
MRPRACLLASLLVLFGPATARGQERLPLSEILPQLLGNTIVLSPTALPDQPNHEAHFQPGVDQLEVPGQFNRALLNLLSTYPIGSPSGGFTYTLDPVVGTFRRTSESFGPAFAERALTIGQGKLSLGFGYQHATYDTFEGLNLRQREVKFYVPHVDCCSRAGGPSSQPDGSLLTPAFEGDLVEAALSLDLTTDTSVAFVTYGVTDRLDLWFAVPFLNVTMHASVLASVQRLSTDAEPEIHAFPGATPDRQLFSASGSATGLGDVVVRAKYRLVPTAGGGVAAALDLRVPTGDETNLLGTGGVQARVYGVASTTFGRFSPHLNAGYTFSSDGGLPGTRLRDEVNVAAGFDMVLSPRATLAVTYVGRTLLDAGRLREVDKQFTFVTGGTGSGGGGAGGGGGGGGGGARPVEEVMSVMRRELQLEAGNLQLHFGSATARFSPWRSLLITAGLLFPLTDTGLRDRVTPVIGIDYEF